MRIYLGRLLKKFRFQKKIRALKNFKSLSALSFIAIVWALVSGSVNAYVIWCVTLIVPIVSLILIYHNNKSLNYYYYLEHKESVVGENINFSYDLINNSIVPITDVTVYLELSRENYISQLSKENLYFKGLDLINRDYEVKCNRRGYYKLGCMGGVIRDPFSIFEFEKVFNKNIDLVIYPKIYSVESINIKPSELFGSYKMNYPINDDYTNIRDLRNYRIGDSLKNAHWKLSAKYDKLIIKNYELNANIKVEILLDSFKGKDAENRSNSLEEFLVSVAGSIVSYSLKRGIETTLKSSKMGNQEGIYVNSKDASMFKIFLNDLVYFQIDGDMELYEYVNRESVKWNKGANILILTLEPTYKLLELIVNLKERQIVFRVICVVENDLEYDDLKSYAITSGVSLIFVNKNSLNNLWEA